MAVSLYHKDTIAAISTPLGEGGIGIVRLSGPKAVSIVEKIFIPKTNKKLSESPGFSLCYGLIKDKQKSNAANKNKINRQRKNGIIDEAIVSLMRAPKTYTREDVVEINSHGGIITVRKILELVLAKGARLADPGEFTQRAFLNGRIDLVQAEAVLNVIKAKTEAALVPAMAQLQGVFSAKINNLKSSLIEIIAPLEAEIDFPDESINKASRKKLVKNLKSTLPQIEGMLKNADKGIMLQNGVSMVLAGAANVGKSSLMNAFVDYERVIVTHISGTTRDVVEEMINIKGVPVRIADTAGIMDSTCTITKESITRSLIFFEKSDLVLFVLDASKIIKKEDLEVAEKIKHKKVIIVINKCDLKNKINLAKVKKIFPRAVCVYVSALKKTGLEKLEKQILQLFFHGEVFQNDAVIISNVRQKDAVAKAYEYIKNGLNILERKEYDECVVFELKQALIALNEVIGENITEDILDAIFSSFCIGK